MNFPVWIDLKGQDSVPDTVHHVVCLVDPVAVTNWKQLSRHWDTDGVHAKDRMNFNQPSKGTCVLRLKFNFQKAINTTNRGVRWDFVSGRDQ